MARARNSDVARLRSATYSPEASRAWVSSIDCGNGAGMGSGRKSGILLILSADRHPGSRERAYHRFTVKSRRRFLASALAFAAAPLAGQEKPAAKLYRIAMLEAVPIAASAFNLGEFHRGMKELGHEEGRTYIVLYRSSDGRVERFSVLAGELAKQGIDVFLTRGTPATLAARDTESGIPVVASAVADFVEAKLATSAEK